MVGERVSGQWIWAPCWVTVKESPERQDFSLDSLRKRRDLCGWVSHLIWHDTNSVSSGEEQLLTCQDMVAACHFVA